MIEIQSIDHVVLRTDRMSEMLHFYCNVLGCHEERRLDDLGLVQLRAGAALIDLVDCSKSLGLAGGEPPRPNGRNMEHVCLLISAVDEAQLQAYFNAHAIGTEELAERYGATGYGRSLYIKDPQGNNVEIKLAT